MSKYHIKDDGTPGSCSAKTVEACPKNKNGENFHGTFEEVLKESQKRLLKSNPNYLTSVKKENNKKEEIIKKYDSLVSEHGARENTLRTACNKARSQRSYDAAAKIYNNFLNKTNYNKILDTLSKDVKKLGFSSISALKADQIYNKGIKDNGNLKLPPKFKKEEVIPYSFDKTYGWLTAVKSSSGEENQYFIYQDENNKWISSFINKDINPIGLNSRIEIRPDNLKTFNNDIGTERFQPKEKLAGIYEIK